MARSKGFSRKSGASSEIPSSSMADIAFLLLIFFIVSTTFPEIGLPMILPSKSGETKQVKRYGPDVDELWKSLQPQIGLAHAAPVIAHAHQGLAARRAE